MPLKEAMHSLVEGLIGAHEGRTAGIAYLRGEVSVLRQADQAQLREMARRQRVDLARGRAGLKEKAGGYRQGTQVHLREIKASVRERRQATQTQIHELNQACQSMSEQQRADLASGRTALHQATQGQLRVMRRNHQAMAKKLRADLSGGHAGLKANVGTQCQELDRDHNAMAQRLREDLEWVPAELMRVERRRKSEVKTWLEDVAASRAGARAAWWDFVTTKGAILAGAVAVAEAPPQVAAPPYGVRAVAPAITTEDDAIGTVVVGEVTTEFASMSDRVFVYLANHPDGARLTELEREIGLSRFQAARAVRHLIDEGKAEKRDLCYFAI